MATGKSSILGLTMRLYLSSFRIGNRPEALVGLMRGGRRVALVLNADDYKSPPERRDSLEREMAELKAAGLEPSELDLRQYFGRRNDLSSALEQFDAVYVRGGNVFILRRAFDQSGFGDLIRDMLARDTIVYAGYSAGPCMLGPTLRGIEGYEDDPEFVPSGYNPDVIWDGLGVLPYVVLPHYDSEGEATRERVRFYIEEHILFVALSDGEVLVIDGNDTRVVR